VPPARLGRLPNPQRRHLRPQTHPPRHLETLLVAARHDNVYLDISGHRPSRMATPGFGWEPLITLGASSLRHRILFGTCTWLTPQPANLLATEGILDVALDVAKRAEPPGTACADRGMGHAARPPDLVCAAVVNRALTGW
jgi:hypothetical protein